MASDKMSEEDAVRYLKLIEQNEKEENCGAWFWIAAIFLTVAGAWIVLVSFVYYMVRG